MNSYRLISTIYSNEEEQLSHKKADTQVLMNGVTITLEAPKEAESEDTYQEADQREQDSHPSNNIQE